MGVTRIFNNTDHRICVKVVSDRVALELPRTPYSQENIDYLRQKELQAGSNRDNYLNITVQLHLYV